MIRKMQPADLEPVLNFLLAATLQAHSFIDPAYWHNNLEPVRQMLPQAEVYVYAETANSAPLGLIGLDPEGDYIAGLFVASEAQAQGIGKQLLDYAKSLRSQLTLRVYQQNERALRFYQREGFQIENEQIDEATGAAEYLMHWQAY